MSAGDNVYLVEKELLPKLMQIIPSFQDSSVIEGAYLRANHLNGLKYRSPFVDSSLEFPLLPSDHVSSKQGTGLVHIAPALGHDDFKIGLKYGLENRCVIDSQGKYTDDEPVMSALGLTSLKVLDQTTTNRIKVD